MNDRRTSGNGDESESGFIRRGGLWVLCQAVLFFAAFGGAVIFPGCWYSPAMTVAGLCLLGLAGLAGLAGAVSLGGNLSPFPQPLRASRLVQSGIYRLVRHPLYTAVFCAALGWSLLFGSGLGLAGALCLGLFLDAKARAEERALRRRFAEYEAYQRRVKRFIPWVY